MSAVGIAALGGGTALAQGRGDPAAIAVLKLATVLENGYVIPAIGHRYAAMLRAKLASGAYAGLSDPAALADRLTADLAAVSQDGHLRVVPEVALPPADRPNPVPAPPGTAAPRRRGPLPIEDAGWLANGVAYIRFTGFPDDPSTAATCEIFMRDHAIAKTLIIDCRYNGGGGIVQMNAMLPFLYPRETRLVRMEMVDAVAKAQGGGPFDGERSVRAVPSPAPRIVAQEHYVVPRRDEMRLFGARVFYLISNRTASAAEHLALAFKRTKRATLIGETTAGANHFGSFEAIGMGLAVFLPVGRTVDPDTGKDWEGVGIAPDVAVSPTLALQKALQLAGAM